jgi:glutathione S-transferase
LTRYLEAALELQNDMFAVADEKDSTKIAQLEKKFSEEVLPKHLRVFENRLAKNGTGYLVGNSLTVADIFLFRLVDELNLFYGPRTVPALANSVQIRGLEERVKNNPRISEWLKKRPITQN